MVVFICMIEPSTEKSITSKAGKKVGSGNQKYLSFHCFAAMQ